MTEDTAADPARRYQLYGRRRGRPLRRRRAHLLETLLPTVEIAPPPPGSGTDPAAWFGDVRPRAVWLEVGFGGGEHLATQAARHRDIGFIGCEPFLNGVASLMTLIEDLALTNVRVLPDDARPLLAGLADRTIDRCFVLFSDPWPKARHAERRFIGPSTLDQLARIMPPGAELRLASDDPTLIRWTVEQMTRHPAFAWTATCAADWRVRPDDWPPTRYEEKAIAAGRRPVYLRYVRR